MDRAIRIQPFHPRNIGRIAAIERASFGDEAWDRKLLLDYFLDSPELFLIIKSGRRITGYILTVARLRTAEIVSIAVDPCNRKRGIGTAMLDATRVKLRSRGIKTCWLMVCVTNQAAIRFYKQYGFTRVRLVPDYYSSGQDAWRMRLSV